MRNRKIKRYGNRIFSNRRHTGVWKVIAWVLVLALLAVGGYYLAKLLLDGPSPNPSEPPSQSDTAKPSGGTTKPTTKPQPEPQTVLEGLRCSTEILTDQTALEQFLNEAKANGYNSIFFDLKNAKGQVFFATATKLGVQAEATVKKPVDLKALAELFKQKGITGVPVLHAFQDPLAAGKVRQAAVWYNNGIDGFLWLDGYADKGGKPWLNPYAQMTRDYITGLQAEVMDAGFDTVILDSVYFAGSVQNDSTYYGEESKQTSRLALMTTFVQACEKVAEDHNGRVFFALSAQDLIGDTSKNLGDSFLKTNPKALAPVFHLQTMGKVTVDGQLIEKPADAPEKTTQAVMAQLQKQLPDCQLMPIFSDYEQLAQKQVAALGDHTPCLIEKK